MKVEMISQMLAGTEHYTSLKIVWGLVIGLVGYLIDLQLIPAITALATLSLLDLCTAFMARGEHPTEPFSRPIRKTGHKLAGYFVSIASVFILSTILTDNIGINITSLDNFLVGFFIIHEVISIIENLNTSGIPIPLPFINKLKKVRETLENK